MSKERMDRRTFLKLAAVTSAAVVAQSCMPAATPEAPAEEEPEVEAPPADTPATTEGFGEAPMLAERVTAGELPPVEDRLPPEPRVIEPYEEVGQYGGTVRVSIGNANQLFGDPQGVMGTECILRIDDDFVSITGGLCKSWEFNEDATEQVLYLREGLRWSDGEPFTAEDFRFAWEDCQLNEELNPQGPSSSWTTGEENVPLEMEIIDDYTIKLSFADPYPLIILEEGHYAGAQGSLWQPKHYLQQFHPSYTEEEDLQQEMEAGEFENWMDLFGNKGRTGSTLPAAVDLPGMTAFIRTADSPDHHTYERNPYYWKVDTAGNQLPYYDKVIVYIIQSPELITTRLISGELDFVGHNSLLKNMELYNENLEAANMRIELWDSTLGSAVLFEPNQTDQDPELRELFQNKNVRFALSMGLDREEINDAIHFGLGEPRQWALWPNSKYYQEGDEKYYAEYDPDRANELLDEAGYDTKDDQGYRLFPSGKRVGWVMMYDPEQGDIPATLELAIPMWKDLGIEIMIKPINRELLNERYAANELHMPTWQGDVASDILWPNSAKAVIPGRANVSWCRAWEVWLWEKGQYPELEEEPPDWVKGLKEDLVEFNRTVDEQGRIEIARKMWDTFYEYLPAFGTCGLPQAIVLKQNFRNFPAEGIWGFACIRAVPVHPEQFFLKQT